MVIYNRWGEKVKEFFSQNDSWDGNYNGQPAEGGVYVYYIEITCIQGQKYSQKGNVTLLR
jgi:gliding motility-associated-like protein